MVRLSRRLWGGTSLKTAAKEASSLQSAFYTDRFEIKLVRDF